MLKNAYLRHPRKFVLGNCALKGQELIAGGNAPGKSDRNKADPAGVDARY
jgi:hypothetical protein